MKNRKVSKRRLYIEDVAEILGITVKAARRRYEKGSLPKPKREPRNGKPRLYWQPAVMRGWLEEHMPWRSTYLDAVIHEKQGAA